MPMQPFRGIIAAYHELPWVDIKALVVVVASQLQERRVEPDDPELDAVERERSREIARHHAAVDALTDEPWRAGRPFAVRGEIPA